jgi:hypothetical protein
MTAPSSYRGELHALLSKLERAASVLTNETRPQAFEAETLAASAQKPGLREIGRELEAMAERLSVGLTKEVGTLLAEDEAGSFG